jgi:hypothetical protein
LTSEIPYEKGRGLYYLDAVGGADAKGWKKKAYIIYPMADEVHSCFFTNYQKVTQVHNCSGKTGS